MMQQAGEYIRGRELPEKGIEKQILQVYELEQEH